MHREDALKSTAPTLMPKGKKPFVSLVLPCLNEEGTLGETIFEAKKAFSQFRFSYEIIVADNGSTDRSKAIARASSVRLIEVNLRGYGAALSAGINAAIGDIVLIGDSDLTYDFSEGPRMVEKLIENGSHMVIGSRMKGVIVDGAMPLLHRYFGTPLLTWLINFLFRSSITDCNSGFRAFYKKNFNGWNIKSTGMEMASEMIVNCLKSGDLIAEESIVFRKDKRKRKPHLSTWRDGMRHLLVILSRAPHMFTFSGLFFLTISSMVAIPSIVIGPTTVIGVSIFDYHSLILATLIGFIGAQNVSFGLMLDSNAKRPLAINIWLMNLNEVVLLKLMLLLGVLLILFVSLIIYIWFKQSFNDIHYLRASLSALYVASVLGSLGIGIFMAQIQSRT